MKRAHWWKSGSREDVRAGMKLHRPELAHLYERAAFNYEVDARRLQRDAGARKPLYRYAAPFPKLPQEQKDILRAEFPSRSGKPFPLVGKPMDERALTRYSAEDQDAFRTLAHAGRDRLEAEGFIRLEIVFNPATMDVEHLLGALRRRIAAETEARGLPKHKPRSGHRLHAYPWHVIELADRKLAGERLTESEGKNVNNIFSRQLRGEY